MDLSVVFEIVVAIIGIAITIFMPKRLTWQEIYTTAVFTAGFNLYIDFFYIHALGQYYFMGTNYTYLFIEAFLGASLGVIYLNYLPQERRNFIRYLIGWTCFSIFYEWLSCQIGYMKYTGWNLIYSLLWYVVIFLFLRWQLFFLRRAE